MATTAADPAKSLVELRGIRKAFGGVHAVDGVDINLYAGEVVALLGHNGAGKSTLMKMLAGAYPVDSGDTVIAGQTVHIRTPADAQHLGIETIYQTLALADNLDAVANLFLGREKLTPGERLTITSWKARRARCASGSTRTAPTSACRCARSRADSGRSSRSRARSTSMHGS